MADDQRSARWKSGSNYREEYSMSYLSVIREEQKAIFSVTHMAILYGIMDAWRRCNNRDLAPQEPDVVASLVLESTPVLHSALAEILQPHRMNVSVFGVYCHQTPKVKFAGMRKTSCELGDLLLVHKHTQRSGLLLRNSLLFQAKMSARQPYRISHSESDQLALFTTWPDFQYHSSGALTGMQRSVKPKMLHTGAQYLLIDDRPPTEPHSGLLGLPGTYPIGSCMPDDLLHDHSDLASEVLQFLLYRSGRPFEDRSDSVGRGDWSELVWDLINVGVTKAFTRRLSGRAVVARGAGDPIEMCDGRSFSGATSPTAYTVISQVIGKRDAGILFRRAGHGGVGDERPNRELAEPPSGISIILIETSEAREE